MPKQIFKLVIVTDENNVQISIDVDKEKFNQIIEPFILANLKRVNTDKTS